MALGLPELPGSSTEKEGMQFLLGGEELTLTTASVLRTMDTGADEANCVVEWTEGKNPDFDALAAPRSLADMVVSIRGQKLITGYKYITDPSLSGKGQLGLGGFSKTIGLIISNPPVQREFLETNLLDISNEYCKLFGIQAKSDGVDTEVSEKFDDEKIAAQAKIFGFLQDLARQRGILTSSDENGNLLYLKANTGQSSVGSIVEGEDGIIPVTNNFSARFDDREVFQNYIAVNDSPYAYLLKEPQAISKDTRIKVASFKTIVLNSLIKGAGQKSVDFARNQSVAKGLSLPFEVNTWDDPKGNLWRENTLVSVQSPSLFVPGGFTFLIRAVQYNLDSRGETAILSLVPPSLYTDKAIDEPWGEASESSALDLIQSALG